MKHADNINILPLMKKMLAVVLLMPLFFSCDSDYEEFNYEVDPNPKQLITYTVGVVDYSSGIVIPFSTKPAVVRQQIADSYDYVVYNAVTMEFVHRQMGVVSSGMLTMSDLLPQGQYIVVFLLVGELDKSFTPSHAQSDVYNSGSSEVFQEAVLLNVGSVPSKVDVGLKKRTGTLYFAKQPLPNGTVKVEVKIFNLTNRLEVQSGNSAAYTAMLKEFTPQEWIAGEELLINAIPSGVPSYVEVTFYDRMGSTIEAKVSNPFTLTCDNLATVTFM